MALNFPNSPANGQIFTDSTTGVKFVYYSTPGVWKRSTGTAGNSISMGSTPPSSPSSGDLWYYTVDGQIYIYYNDGDSSQWVTAVGGGQLNNANNALNANNSSYLGGIASASYVTSSSLSGSLGSYATLSSPTFTGTATFANTLYNNTAVFSNTIAVTGNATFSNIVSFSGVSYFNANIVSNNIVIVGNTSISNSAISVGTGTANATLSYTSLTISNSTSSTTISPGSINSSNTFLSGSTSIATIFESATIIGTPATGTINIDILTSPTVYYSIGASSNFTANIRGNSSTTLGSLLSVGQSVSVAIIVNQGGSAYYPNSFTIDGVSTSVKWAGGVTAVGDASAINIYSYSIIKTTSSTYSVVGCYNKYS